VTGRLWHWSERTGLVTELGPDDPAGVAPAPGDAGAPLVADSWLVTDGTVRGFDRHRRRFAGSCAALAGVDCARVAAFWADVAGAVPTTGRWFPRAELTIVAGLPRLGLRIRPAGATTATVRLWVPDHPDPRRQPRHKGPDLALLSRLRQRAAEHGAEEALLTAADGTLVEAATANLLWWEGDTLCRPAPDLPALNGVTQQLIERRAAALGVPVAHRHVRLAELTGREVWLVNARHGIRPVTAWRGAPGHPAPPRRAGAWRRWWWSAGEPLDRYRSPGAAVDGSDGVDHLVDLPTRGGPGGHPVADPQHHLRSAVPAERQP
jgi:branched-subunit amino acid aminotransferase/4-amino-4-deoxychorismate lyase